MSKYEIRFTKEGNIRYISHLDVMRMFRRAFKRAGLDLVYSNGFNPHPKMSIAVPLSLGLTSMCEWMDIETEKDTDPDELLKKLQKEMPKGITIAEVKRTNDKKTLASRVTAAKYLIAVKLPVSVMERITGDSAEKFMAQDHIIVMKRQKKKKELKEVDIRGKIRSFLLHKTEYSLCISTVLDAGSSSNLNPDILLNAFLSWLGDDAGAEDSDIMRQKLYFD